MGPELIPKAYCCFFEWETREYSDDLLMAGLWERASRACSDFISLRSSVGMGTKKKTEPPP